jgi:hypothetical protein
MERWICAGAFGVGLIAFAILIHFSRRAQARIDAKIESEGEAVLGYIAIADPGLYEKSNSNSHAYAIVVFTTEAAIPNREETLREWAEKLLNYKPPQVPSESERIIGSVLKTLIPFFHPIRLPAEITGAWQGYTISLKVPWRRFPGRKVSGPFIHFKVLLGNEPRRDGVFTGEGVVIDQPEV